MAVKVLDAGGKLMLSGDQRDEVEAALAGYMKRGSKSVAGIQKVGAAWVAACTLPTKESDIDNTSTLGLAEIQTYDSKPGSPEPEFDDGCRVEELGFKRIITGPSRRAVELRIEHLKRFGAEVVGDIEQDGNSWIAVVDTGGADKTYKY